MISLESLGHPGGAVTGIPFQGGQDLFFHLFEFVGGETLEARFFTVLCRRFGSDGSLYCRTGQ